MCKLQNRLLFIILLFIFGCATYKPQYKDSSNLTAYPSYKTVEKTFYLIGDAGYAKANQSTPALLGLKKVLDTASKQDYVIFLGDNIYPNGMPKKGNKHRAIAEHRLNVQLDAVKDFKGEIIFIPGNHDWYDEGIKGLDRQEDYFEERLKDKKVFLPSDGCGLTDVDVSENIQLIIIDSQWFLEDWDNHPGINDDCPEIKTREAFFLEIESLLKKHQNKTIVFALHHPLLTYGPHGGKFAAEKHLYPTQHKIPMPGLASLITLIRKSGGVSIQDRINERYNKLANRLMTLAKDAQKIIFVSGHEHSLQYNKEDNIPQIVSGSGAKISATKLTEYAQFTYGGYGFAVLDVFTDGSSWVRYYATKPTGTTLIYQTQIHEPNPKPVLDTLPTKFPSHVKASVYKPERTQRSKFYKSILGKHYRSVYGTLINAKTVNLDTLYGGLKPVRMGGGHQSKTLRLVDKNGKEYNMRALKKSAVKFLQSVVFKDTHIENKLENTLPEDLILDFYTAAHPYTPFIIDELSAAVSVYHTNPKLFYVPKQKALGKYNNLYGDELYMIEERPMEAFSDLESFGKPDDVESTADLYKKLREDEKYKLDERAYIRARLFDMLIGDWDRHEDQWRWAEFEKENGDHIFKPIPRDRDQAFSNFDGLFLGTIRALISSSRLMQVYNEKLKDLQWFNIEALPLDRTLIKNATTQDWVEEAKFIQENLTDQVIDKAFSKLPKEVQDQNIPVIKQKLKGRRSNLVSIAKKYSKIVNRLAILTATDKDDYIEVIRSGDNETTVKIFRIKDGKKADTIVNKTFNRATTKEIWIYGLDDDDVFEVSGKANNPIFVRLIGGQNNDVYKIKNGRRVNIYDHKSKKNTIQENNGAKIKLTDLYNVNLFNYKKDEKKTTNFFPAFGYNPDDGFKIGVKAQRTKFGFERNPFTKQFTVQANYFFATSGFEFLFDGEIANIFNKANFTYGVKATSENFTQNFFGYGSNTPNFDDDLGLDYNRVKISYLSGYIGFVRRSNYGSDFSGKLRLDGVEVEDTENRFVNTFFTSQEDFKRKYFLTAQATYTFKSFDNTLNPKRGMLFTLTPSYTINAKETRRNFGYVKSALMLYNSLTNNKKLVLKSKVAGRVTFGDEFEFYQAATLGGRETLRGFRDERFTGKNSLVLSTDLRYSFETFKTPFLPLQIGVYGGFDYGRVWVPNDVNDAWQKSYGGGLWILMADSLNTDLTLFNSTDGLRFTFGFGFRF